MWGTILDRKKISEMKDLTSTSTTCDKHDGGRSGNKTTTTTVVDPSQEILKAVNGMLALTWIDNRKVNEEDMSDMIENMDALLDEKKIEKPVRKMYQQYQNLWTSFCAKESIKEEYDDVSLVKFFKQVEPSYWRNPQDIAHAARFFRREVHPLWCGHSTSIQWPIML